ncbi:MAG: hypothetical protein NC924_01305 [Candidatus Omnitrophica bacterium]|nr:hypothetical protein [Candidatus Omnitrophota bacterium]
MNILSARLNFAFLCDYASVSREGKLSLNGIFENINTRALPMHHPLMYVVANVSGAHEGDRFTCEITPQDNPALKVAAIASQVNIDTQQRFGFIGQFVNVRYELAGAYFMKFYIDNKELGSLTFFVRLMA